MNANMNVRDQTTTITNIFSEVYISSLENQKAPLAAVTFVYFIPVWSDECYVQQWRREWKAFSLNWYVVLGSYYRVLAKKANS